MTGSEQQKAARVFQRDLKKRGFDPGPIDGQPGKWTMLAVQHSSSVCHAVDDARTGRELVLAHALATVGKLPRELVTRLVNSNPDIVGTGHRLPAWNYNTALVHHWACLAGGPGQTAVAYVRDTPALLSRPTWTAGLRGIPPQPGDIFGVWYETLGAPGHCGLVLDWCAGEKYFLSLEAAHGDTYSPHSDGWPRACMRRRLRADAYCCLHVPHAAQTITDR